MTWKACLEEIERAAGRTLTDEESIDLLTELERRIDQKRLGGKDFDPNQAVKDAAEEYAADMAEAAMIEKRNAAINLKVRLEAVDRVRTSFSDNVVHGLESLLVGVNRPVPGARVSVAAGQKELTKKYIGGLIADLSQKDLWKTFTSGKLDREIARAMWARNRDEPFPVDVPREAIDIADDLSKWQEMARQDANKAGAWVKKMPGYIVRQSHDMFRIERAGFEAWRDSIMPKLDWERIVADQGDVQPHAFLSTVYEALASGVHLKTPGDPTGFTGPRNIAKKMSQERVLHFKTADDWFDYNQEFGSRTLSNAVIKGLEIAGQNTGLMRVLGTNPQANFRAIQDDLMRKLAGDIKQKRALNHSMRPVLGKLSSQMAEVDGTTRMPANAMGAQIAGIERAFENMSKLGGAVISQFSDLPINAMSMRYEGFNFLQSIGTGLRSIGDGYGPKDRQQLYGSLGVVFDAMRGDVMSRHSTAHDDMPGVVARMQQMFFKANFMVPWTDRLRAGTARALAHRLALNTDNGWDNLDPALQNILSMYGMERAEWDVIRQAPTIEADGRAYVTPETIADMPDEAFWTVAASRGREVTPARIAAVKDEIASKLRTYYTDRADIAVSIPDAGTRATWTRGTQPGTVEGELLRFIGQFKSFPTAVLRMHVGREVFGRGAKSWREAGERLMHPYKQGNGELLGIAQLMLSSMAFGYLAMSAKDLVKGREPRDPLDHKTWLAAMVQGGGMGIYGDFLFGELRTRYGGGPVAGFLGPAAGTAERLFDLVGRAREGDDLAAASLRTVMASTPFANLFYSRIVLDYLFLHSLQESLNPGSLRRMEKRIEKENSQKFYMRPSQDRVRVFE